MKVLEYIHSKHFVHKQIDSTKIIFNGKKVIVTGLGNSRQYDPVKFEKNP